MHSRQESNSAESHLLGAIRNALLPKLISGEIRAGQGKKIMKEVA